MNEDYELLYAAIRADPDNTMIRLALADRLALDGRANQANYIREEAGKKRKGRAPLFDDFIEWGGPWSPRYRGDSRVTWRGHRSSTSKDWLTIVRLFSDRVAVLDLQFDRGLIFGITAGWTIWVEAAPYLVLNPLNQVRLFGVPKIQVDAHFYNRGSCYAAGLPLLLRTVPASSLNPSQTEANQLCLDVVRGEWPTVPDWTLTITEAR